ncbi:MAG: hypothetical protein KDK78_11640, partial [Chlamydiia bacterium]|nr:hypothetical protein [Chlamydiia bacterium]
MIPVNPIDNAGPPMEPPMLPRKRTADEAEILDERPAKIACIRAMEDLIDELGLSSSESDPLWTDESSSSYDGSDEMSTDSDDEDDNPWGWKPVQDPWSQPPPSFFIEDIDKGISGPGGPGQPPIPPTKVTIRYLAKLLRHLSAEAREGQFEDLFNQRSIIRRIEQSMLCNTSVELRGSEERGKRSIIHRFVHMLTHDNVPSQLKNREVFEIDIEQLMQEEGEDWHLLFQQYIDDCFALRDDVIICIPHIQLISGRGRRGAEASEHLQRRINEGLLVITTADSRTFTNYMKDVTVPFETIRIADSEHKKLLEELDQRKARKHHSEAVKALYNKYHQLAENGGIPVHRAVIEAAVDFAEAKATETQIKNGELETLAAVWIERSIAEQKLVMAERNAEA